MTSSGQSRAAIVPANIEALQPIYTAWQLEQLLLFRVADRVVERWLQGVLPVGEREGRSILEAYWRGASGRLSERERGAVYARAFGAPGGDPAQAPNQQFDDLWLRFLTSVSAYRRQRTAGGVLDEKRLAAREAAVRKAGRDLAANASLYGFGSAPAAKALRRQIDQAIRVLRTGAVQRAYGSRDVWELAARVARLELGGAPDTVRGRTRAQAGATIIRWLALRASKLSSSRGHVLNVRELRSQPKSPTPLVTPTDRDLVDACEQWLAVTGVADRQANDLAQPAETQCPDAVTLRAVRPAVRRLLESSKSFNRLPPESRKSIARDTVKVAGYLAQPHGTPEVDLPAFVAGLMQGVFDAVVDASIEQMRAYGDLIAGVAKTVDGFVKDAISDGDGRRWLCARYPDLLALTFVEHRDGRLAVVARDAKRALAAIGKDLCLPRLSNLRDADQELELARRARVRLARGRQQLLATMVLMGVNRRR